MCNTQTSRHKKHKTVWFNHIKRGNDPILIFLNPKYHVKRLKIKKGSADGRKFKGEEKKNYKLSNQIVCVIVSIYIYNYIIIYKI